MDRVYMGYAGGMVVWGFRDDSRFTCVSRICCRAWYVVKLDGNSQKQSNTIARRC